MLEKNTDLTSAGVKHNNRDEWFYNNLYHIILTYADNSVKKKRYTWNNHALMSIFCIYLFLFIYSFLLKSPFSH